MPKPLLYNTGSRQTVRQRQTLDSIYLLRLCTASHKFLELGLIHWDTCLMPVELTILLVPGPVN